MFLRSMFLSSLGRIACIATQTLLNSETIVHFRFHVLNKCARELHIFVLQ
jgi:hypothetical protein